MSNQTTVNNNLKILIVFCQATSQLNTGLSGLVAKQ
jgi:hypothetical protein